MQIRYHSAYPWHDKGEYKRFMAPGDEELLQWVKEFNKVRAWGGARMCVVLIWGRADPNRDRIKSTDDHHTTSIHPST